MRKLFDFPILLKKQTMNNLLNNFALTLSFSYATELYG